MKFRCLLTAAMAILPGVNSRIVAEDAGKPWPPQAYPESRYEETWSRNPFNLKTAPVAETRASFAANLAIAGISAVGDNKAVILVDRNSRKYQRVTDQPNAFGISLVALTQDGDIAGAVAEIEKDGEKAVVRFEAIANRKRPENGSGKKPKDAGEGRSGNSNQSNGREESGKSDER